MHNFSNRVSRSRVSIGQFDRDTLWHRGECHLSNWSATAHRFERTYYEMHAWRQVGTRDTRVRRLVRLYVSTIKSILTLTRLQELEILSVVRYFSWIALRLSKLVIGCTIASQHYIYWHANSAARGRHRSKEPGYGWQWSIHIGKTYLK